MEIKTCLYVMCLYNKISKMITCCYKERLLKRHRVDELSNLDPDNLEHLPKSQRPQKLFILSERVLMHAQV